MKMIFGIFQSMRKELVVLKIVQACLLLTLCKNAQNQENS